MDFQLDDLLTGPQFADLAGIKPATLRAYKKRGLAPTEDERFGPTPMWRYRTFLTWKSSRPGSGRPHASRRRH